jgi:hypothetical protein
VCAARTFHTELRPYNDEEALSVDHSGAKWIQLAQAAALGSDLYILEDGSEFPKVSGAHADPGGGLLEGMYTEGCASIEQSGIHSRSGSPFPSDNEDEEMTYDQARLIRRFRKRRWAVTESGSGFRASVPTMFELSQYLTT